MKKHSDIRSHLLPSIEGTLDEELQRIVEDHIAQCAPCKQYFEMMSVALLPSVKAPQSALSPDPYLPVRVRALAGKSRANSEAWGGLIVSWTLRTALFFIAVVLGAYLGERLSSPRAFVTSERIITEYSEIFATSGIEDRLEAATLVTEETSR